MTLPNQLEMEQTASRLLAQRDTVLTDIRERLHASGDHDRMALLNHLEAGGDWVEAGLLADTDIALLRHELVRLREIDTALARIKAGNYGTCRECGEPIAPGRLNAQPTAECCLPCQERFEKEHGISHRASL